MVELKGLILQLLEQRIQMELAELAEVQNSIVDIERKFDLNQLL